MQSPTRYMRVVADYMRLPDRFRRTVTYVTIHIPHLGTVLIVADGFTRLVQSNQPRRYSSGRGACSCLSLRDVPVFAKQ